MVYSVDILNRIAGVYNAYDYESITVSTSAVGLTGSKYAPSGEEAAKRVFITVESGSIRYRYDGTDPTSSEGHLITEGGYLTITGKSNIEKFKAIRAGTSDAVLRVTYER